MSTSETPPPARKIPIVPVVLIALLLGFALFGEKGILQALQYTRHKNALQAEVDKQTAIAAELRSEIDALRNDLRAVENIARRELGMVKDDEIVYQFTRVSNSAPRAEGPLALPEDRTGRR